MVGGEHEETAMMERAMVGRHESELWCCAAVSHRVPENQPSNSLCHKFIIIHHTHSKGMSCIPLECAIYPSNSPKGSLLNGKCVFPWLYGCRNTKSKV